MANRTPYARSMDYINKASSLASNITTIDMSVIY